MRKWAPFVPYITVSIGLFIFQNAWVAALAYHLGMAVCIVLAGVNFSIALTGGKNLILLASLAIGLTGGLLLFWLWHYLGIPGDIVQYLLTMGLTTDSWPFFIIYFILINALLEELYWRGWLGNNSRYLTANDFLYSGYHVLVLGGKMNIIWLIGIFLLLSLAGWFWRQVVRRNQGLLSAVLSHLAADASVIITIYYMTTFSFSS